MFAILVCAAQNRDNQDPSDYKYLFQGEAAHKYFPTEDLRSQREEEIRKALEKSGLSDIPPGNIEVVYCDMQAVYPMQEHEYSDLCYKAVASETTSEKDLETSKLLYSPLFWGGVLASIAGLSTTIYLYRKKPKKREQEYDDPNKVDENGMTDLHRAVAQGYTNLLP